MVPTLTEIKQHLTNKTLLLKANYKANYKANFNLLTIKV